MGGKSCEIRVVAKWVEIEVLELGSKCLLRVPKLGCEVDVLEGMFKPTYIAFSLTL